MLLKCKLYKIMLRGLLGDRSAREPFSKYILTTLTNEVEIVLSLKGSAHSLKWWDEHLITDVIFIEDIWATLPDIKMSYVGER